MRIEATAPEGSGTVPVTVTTPGGTSQASSVADYFIYPEPNGFGPPTGTIPREDAPPIIVVATKPTVNTTSTTTTMTASAPVTATATANAPVAKVPTVHQQLSISRARHVIERNERPFWRRLKKPVRLRFPRCKRRSPTKVRCTVEAQEQTGRFITKPTAVLERSGRVVVRYNGYAKWVPIPEPRR
jgi:hypothetical protein